MLAAIGEVIGVVVNIRKVFWYIGLWTRTAGLLPKAKNADAACGQG